MMNGNEGGVTMEKKKMKWEKNINNYFNNITYIYY